MGVVGDSVQPGTEIDAELWRRFREEVAERRGGVRGHIRTELEAAIRGYIDGTDATPAQLNRRLQRIEAAVGVEATDGGTDTSEPAQCTHTPDQALDAPDSRPHPQSATKKKVAWLATCVNDAESGGSGKAKVIHTDTLQSVVKDEYSFTADTVDRYVDEVIAHLGLVQHPFNDVLFVTEGKRDELVATRREQTRSDARDRMDSVADE